MYIQREILTEIFAPIIWAFVNEFNKITQNGSLNEYEKEKISGRLKDSIGKTLRYWEEEQPKMVSVKARQLCNNYNLSNNRTYDVTQFKYKDRDRLGGKKNDWNIRFDHTTPVNVLIKSLIDCKEEEKVKALLNKTSEICIITRDENKALDDAGFKQIRNDGWEECYKKCGIDI
jgi:hypothetical protein